MVFNPDLGTVLPTHPIHVNLRLTRIQNVTPTLFRREIQFLFDVSNVQHFLLARVAEHLHKSRVDVNKSTRVGAQIHPIQRPIKERTVTFLRVAKFLLRRSSDFSMLLSFYPCPRLLAHVALSLTRQAPYCS
jgi:hypothetical protein